LKQIIGKFKYTIIILLAVVMIYIFSTQYANIVMVIEDKYNSRQELVENNIIQTVNYIDDAYKIAEKQLNKEMKEYSEEMIEKYQKDQDVMAWDLDELQRSFDGYDIYIINKDLKIIRTTYAEDLGLDFSEFGNFATILENRMNENIFEVDRFDLSTQAGEIKKYSYMPSPDHEYLFELSVSIEGRYPSFDSLNIFKDATNLTEKYDVVKNISFYSVELLDYGVAELRNTERPFLNPDVPDFKEELARQAVINNTVQKSTDTLDGIEYIYRFFPALISNQTNEQGWNSYVVGITYNNEIMQDEINKHKGMFIINILLIGILFTSFIIIVIYILREFEYQANHDSLTELSNRKYFVGEFNKLKGRVDADHSKIGIIFIDIDKFKEINDIYGHDIGDQVLKNIATRIKNNLKDKDLKARMGGDEFLLGLVGLNSKEKIVKVTNRLINELKVPLKIDGKEIIVSVSAGMSIYPDDSDVLEELIINADTAMYKAKKENQDLENQNPGSEKRY